MLMLDEEFWGLDKSGNLRSNVNRVSIARMSHLSQRQTGAISKSSLKWSTKQATTSRSSTTGSMWTPTRTLSPGPSSTPATSLTGLCWKWRARKKPLLTRLLTPRMPARARPLHLSLSLDRGNHHRRKVHCLSRLTIDQRRLSMWRTSDQRMQP